MAWWIPATMPSGLIYIALFVHDRTWLYTWSDMATFFSSVLPSSLLWLTCGVGLLTGVCQWLVLRRQLRLSMLWIPISVFIFGIVWPFVEALMEALGGGAWWSYTIVWAITAEVIIWTATALLIGLPLAWLVASQQRPVLQ